MRTTIPEADLNRLEERVRELMGSGQWQSALLEIRAAAVLYGMSHKDLLRKVADRAIEEGHVKQLPQVPDPD